jgi:uncharacterized protein (TIGR03437 family)
MSATEIDIGDDVVLPLFVSETQINYVVPAGLTPGHYRAVVKSGGSVIAQGNLELDPVAPALFAAATQIVRVHPDGTQTVEDVGGAIDFGDPADRVFLVLYGTGFRHLTRSSLQVGGMNLAIAYAGAQGSVGGLDQLNAEMPRSLAGAGQVAVAFTADGKMANAVTLSFR